MILLMPQAHPSVEKFEALAELPEYGDDSLGAG